MTKNLKYYEARKRAWTKYNHSNKKKIANKKYREAHKEECKIWVMAWQKLNRERIRELEKKRLATPHGKAIRRDSQTRYNKKNRIKRLAKDAIHNALIAGKIIRPNNCSMCKVKCRPDGHHFDYLKPLKVVWVCKKCHIKIHLKTKRLELPKSIITFFPPAMGGC